MGCPKNIKHRKFFIWKWDVEEDHPKEIAYINKFMRTSEDFIVHWYCPLCESMKKEHFVTHEELIRMGLKIEEINKITDWDYYYPKIGYYAKYRK